MDQTITARYAREVQKVQRKTEEVNQLMAEAKRLDLENKNLIVNNTRLKENTQNLESALAKKSDEFQVLEVQVKKQQLRLQHFIDQEANSAAAKATKTAEEEKRRKELQAKHGVEVEELHKRMDALHDSRKSLSEAMDLYQESNAVLTSENNKLREEVHLYDTRLEKIQREFKEKDEKSTGRVGNLEAQIEKISKSQQLADEETAEISTMDLQAKNGLKAEFLALVTEVDRLQNEVENERTITFEAKKEVAREAEQLQSLRRITEESARLSAAEVEAVGVQQEVMLRDLKSAVKDRDDCVKRERDLRNKVTQLEAALTAVATPAPTSNSSSPSQSQRPVTAVLDEATTEEMKQQAQLLTQQQEQISELQQVVEDLSTNYGAARNDLESSKKVHEDLMNNQALDDEREALRAELYDQLKAERDHLYIENQLLQGHLDEAQQALRQSNAKAATVVSASGISAPELNEVDAIVYSLLSLSNQVLHEIPSSNRSGSTQSDTSTTSESGNVLPTVKCDRYATPTLNAVHRKLGGVTYILKKMKSRLRRMANAAGNPAALGSELVPNRSGRQANHRNPQQEYRQVASDTESTGSVDGTAPSRDPESVLAAAAARLSTTRSSSAQHRSPHVKEMDTGSLSTRATSHATPVGGGIDLRSMIAESEQLLRAVESKR